MKNFLFRNKDKKDNEDEKKKSENDIEDKVDYKSDKKKDKKLSSKSKSGFSLKSLVTKKGPSRTEDRSDKNTFEPNYQSVEEAFSYTTINKDSVKYGEYKTFPEGNYIQLQMNFKEELVLTDKRNQHKSDSMEKSKVEVRDSKSALLEESEGENKESREDKSDFSEESKNEPLDAKSDISEESKKETLDEKSDISDISEKEPTKSKAVKFVPRTAKLSEGRYARLEQRREYIKPVVLGVKVQISLDDTQEGNIQKAWDRAIMPHLIREGVILSKVVNQDTKLSERDGGEQDGKQVTIYLARNPQKSPESWARLLQDINQSLVDENILPGPRPQIKVDGSQFQEMKPVTGSNYMAYQYEGEKDEIYSSNNKPKEIPKEKDVLANVVIKVDNQPEPKGRVTTYTTFTNN